MASKSDLFDIDRDKSVDLLASLGSGGLIVLIKEYNLRIPHEKAVRERAARVFDYALEKSREERPIVLSLLQRAAQIKSAGPPNQPVGSDRVQTVSTAFLLKILSDAQKAVPAVKYAFGVAGVAAAAALVRGGLGYRQSTVLIIGAMFIAMILLLVFSVLITSKSKIIHGAGIGLVCVVVFFITIFIGFTVTAFAIEWPRAWVHFLGVGS